MIEVIEANWPLVLAAFLIGLLIAWYVFQASRKTRVTSESKDVLDEGAAPAARNQALIDAAPPSPPAATPEPTPTSATPPGAAVAGATASAASEPDTPPTPASDGSDDLTRIKGVGKKLAATLHDLGVTSFAQIAEWDDTEIDRIDAQLGRFEGRIRRDSWVEQAKFLAAGDTAGFEGKFGRID